MMKHPYKIIRCTHTNGCKTKFNEHGRYISATPSGAVKKMHTQLCGRKRVKGRCTFRITFVRTDLPVSQRKEYVYITRRIKLKKTVQVNIAGKDVVYKYKIHVEKAPKATVTCPSTHHQSPGTMKRWNRGGSEDDETKTADNKMTREYLNNITILKADGTPFTDDDKTWLIGKSFSPTFFNNFDEEFQKLLPKKFGVSTGWVKCDNDCYTLVDEHIKMEIKSTAYILRALGASLLSSTTEQPQFEIKVIEDITKLTGVWTSDKELFTMKTFLTNEEKGKGTLIFGFGPSASGKTHWAKNIIDVLGRLDPTFPSTFLSIDGGTYREQSLTYQLVIQNIKKTSLDGFRNLVTSNWLRKQTEGILFDSNVVKKQIKNFLTRPQNPRPNLYVPETLGGCNFNFFKTKIKKCRSKINEFTTITNCANDWIGLCIWQHVNPCTTKDKECCPYGEAYRCESTTASGTQREKKEGKIYSSSAWKKSLNNGMTESMKAPNNNWYHIHNTGGYGCKEDNCATSIIEIHEKKAEELLQKKETLKKIQKDYTCEFRISDKILKKSGFRVKKSEFYHANNVAPLFKEISAVPRNIF